VSHKQLWDDYHIQRQPGFVKQSVATSTTIVIARRRPTNSESAGLGTRLTANSVDRQQTAFFSRALSSRILKKVLVDWLRL
jgi:hypothetical protein